VADEDSAGVSGGLLARLVALPCRWYRAAPLNLSDSVETRSKSSPGAPAEAAEAEAAEGVGGRPPAPTIGGLMRGGSASAGKSVATPATFRSLGLSGLLPQLLRLPGELLLDPLLSDDFLRRSTSVA